jgi:hypothetical protein
LPAFVSTVGTHGIEEDVDICACFKGDVEELGRRLIDRSFNLERVVEAISVMDSSSIKTLKYI